MSASYVNPNYLVETDWLELHLADPDLRLFDCTTFLDPDPVATYSVRSGRPNWARGHIPGAGYLDLQGELSDTSSPFRFTMPSAEQFSAAMSRHGVGEGTRVVLYCTDRAGWATRVWWMLRAFGFDAAAVLNGGLDKWIAENRPLSTAAPPPPARAHFVARPRPELIATKSQVAAEIGDTQTRIINALSPEQFTGEGGVHYGRPGRIAGSVNVASRELFDSNKTFLPADRLSALFASAGVDRSKKIIAYCGGGIAASTETFALSLLGHPNVSLYDGSLSEWCKDPAMAMEIGPPTP